MTTADPDGPAGADGKVAPETLELRARPQPVTRINRKVLIGGAAVLLFLISGIVLVALKPPSLRIAGSQELFNVDHKPISDGLSRLPASYDGLKGDTKTEPAKLTKGVPELTVTTVGDAIAIQPETGAPSGAGGAEARRSRGLRGGVGRVGRACATR
jgi:hypothetical protein